MVNKMNMGKKSRDPVPVNRTELPLDTIPDIQIQKEDKTSVEEPPTIEGFNKDDAKDLFENIFKSIGAPVQNIADSINNTTSWMASWFSSDDLEQQVVERNIKLVLTLIISIYVTYNWYFLIFYKEAGQRITRTNLRMQHIADNYPHIFLPLKYNLVSLSSLDWLLCDFLPGMVDKVFLFLPHLKNAVSFVFLYGIVSWAIYHYGELTIQRLVNAAQLKTDASSGLIIAFMFAYGAWSMVSIEDPVTMAQRAIQYMQAPILTLMVYLIRVLLFSIPFVFISTLTVCFYLIFMSLFAIPYYGSPNIMRYIKQIHKYVSQDLDPNPVCGTCHPSLFWMAFKVLVKGPVFFILKYYFQIVLVLTLLYSITDYAINLNEGSTTQWLMITMSMMIILAVVGTEVYTYLVNKQKADALEKAMIHAQAMAVQKGMVHASTTVGTPSPSPPSQNVQAPNIVDNTPTDIQNVNMQQHTNSSDNLSEKAMTYAKGQAKKSLGNAMNSAKGLAKSFVGKMGIVGKLASRVI